MKHQLSFVNNMDVLDFGSGFGVLCDELAKNNRVTAIEPNEEMINNRYKNNTYHQILGDITELKKIPDNSFDLIICHNVLEYSTYNAEIINEFHRIMRNDAFLSIVKHNHNGRIMQKVVFDNAIDEAISILKGSDSFAENFGKINYYDNTDIQKWNSDFKLNKTYGVRTFWGLQQNNDIKFDSDWYENMLKAELAVSGIEDFIKISFFNHLLFTK